MVTSIFFITLCLFHELKENIKKLVWNISDVLLYNRVEVEKCNPSKIGLGYIPNNTVNIVKDINKTSVNLIFLIFTSKL